MLVCVSYFLLSSSILSVRILPIDIKYTLDLNVNVHSRSVRTLFGEDEACYIMDAKVQGNIGRYLNVSTLFIQIINYLSI